MKHTHTLLLLGLLLAACGQSAKPTNTPPTPITIGVTRVSLTITIPNAPTSGQAIQPQYVPTTTKALRVRLGGTDQTLAVTPNSAQCTPGPDGTTCTFTLTLNVAAGSNLTLSVDALGEGMKVLASATSTVTIKLGQDNPLSITLFGVASAASYTFKDRAGDITQAAGSTKLDLGGAYAVGVALSDPSGQVIVDPGRPDDLLCSSNPAFGVTGSHGNFVLTAPDPIGNDQSTTLRVVTGANCATGSELASGTVTVPAETLSLTLDNTAPIAGSTIVAQAALKTALGRALPVAGRNVVFSTNRGSVPTPNQATGSAGTASTNVVTAAQEGSGQVSASVDGLTQNAAFTSVAGDPVALTSSVVFSPDKVQVSGASTLTVTLKDANGNPVGTTPSIVSPADATATLAGTSGNVFTYDVTAPSLPGTYTFKANVGGTLVGQADLTVNAYTILVQDGGAPVAPGSQYDFASADDHTFTVSEQGYAGNFTATSSNPTVATVPATLTGGALTVTPGTAAGISTITVTDGTGQTFQFDVTVTTASITVN